VDKKMKCKECKHLKKKKESYFGVDVGAEYMTCVLYPTHVSVTDDHFCDQFESRNDTKLEVNE